MEPRLWCPRLSFCLWLGDERLKAVWGQGQEVPQPCGHSQLQDIHRVRLGGVQRRPGQPGHPWARAVPPEVPLAWPKDRGSWPCCRSEEDGLELRPSTAPSKGREAGGAAREGGFPRPSGPAQLLYGGELCPGAPRLPLSSHGHWKLLSGPEGCEATLGSAGARRLSVSLFLSPSVPVSLGLSLSIPVSLSLSLAVSLCLSLFLALSPSVSVSVSCSLALSPFLSQPSFLSLTDPDQSL